MLVACCHGVLIALYFKEHIQLKTAELYDYGKVLACSTGFLSTGKLDAKLLLPFLRSDCFQRGRLRTYHWVKQGLLFPLPWAE